jgi:lambda family phage minor tail protein L
MNKITTVQAESSMKKLVTESASLTPSSLISLFELDLTDILEAKGLNPSTFAINRQSPRGYSYQSSDSTYPNESIFRFHNNIKLIETSIYFDSDKTATHNPPLTSELKEYIAIPIDVQGFETTAKGTQATPTLTLTVSEEGITALALFKDIIRQVGDLSGVKVTRIRTYYKYLPPQNFYPDHLNPNYDQYIEYPRDIFYIDRKSNEDKFSIQFELASLLDLEGIKLPLRQIISNRCMWTYRGEGCEYNESNFPNQAIPVADLKDELLADIINYPLFNKGLWASGKIYNKGDFVFINKQIGDRLVPFYYVCKRNTVVTYPTFGEDWIPDQCSKGINGCKLRFSKIGQGTLPMGAFPGVSRLGG